MAETPKNNGRKADGTFAPGNSGGPGKPKGTKHTATRLAEALMHDGIVEITNAVIDAAKQGDIQACKVVLERLVPVRKGRPVSFKLPEVKAAGDLLQASSLILKQMASGDLTPDEAATILSGLEHQRRAIETAELAGRIEKLEAGR